MGVGGRYLISIAYGKCLKFITLYSVLFWPKVCFLCTCCLNYLVEWQTVWTLIRLLLQDQSDLGLHCLHMSLWCSNMFSWGIKKKSVLYLEQCLFWGKNKKKIIISLSSAEFAESANG